VRGGDGRWRRKGSSLLDVRFLAVGLLGACQWLGTHGPAVVPSGGSGGVVPTSSMAFSTVEGQWYLADPNNGSVVNPLTCSADSPDQATARVDGTLAVGEEIELVSAAWTRRGTVARVLPGGQVAPPPFVDARREVGAAWEAGEGCLGRQGTIGCEYERAFEAFRAAHLQEDGVTLRPGGSFFNDVCFVEGPNWMASFAAHGVGADTVVRALVPRWSGAVPWTPSVVLAHCAILSGTAGQQRAAGEALLEMVNEAEVGASNEVRALMQLGLLERLGRTDSEWLARAEPRSEPGRQCLGWERELVEHEVARATQRTLP